MADQPPSPSLVADQPPGYDSHDHALEGEVEGMASPDTLIHRGAAGVSSEEENPFELDSARTAEAIAALPPPHPTHLTNDSWAAMVWATASSKEKLQQFMYSRALMLSVATQILMIIVSAAQTRAAPRTALESSEPAVISVLHSPFLLLLHFILSLRAPPVV